MSGKIVAPKFLRDVVTLVGPAMMLPTAIMSRMVRVKEEARIGAIRLAKMARLCFATSAAASGISLGISLRWAKATVYLSKMDLVQSLARAVCKSQMDLE